MYKFLLILLAAALFSLGLSYPELIMQQNHQDSTLSQMDDNYLPYNSKTKKIIPDYDVPRQDGEPLPPPPPNDDDYKLAPLGP